MKDKRIVRDSADRKASDASPAVPRRKRVAFVLPSFVGGGAERVCLTFAGALERGRFDATIIVIDGRGELGYIVPAHVAVHNLGRRRVRHALWPLFQTLRRVRADVIVPTLGYLNLAVLALRFLLPRSTRVLPREANLPTQSIDAFAVPELARLAYRRLYAHADGVICNSQAVADELKTLCGVPPARIHRIDNPIDVGAIRAAATEPAREPGEGPRFITSGRLTHQKGFDRLLELFAAAQPDARLTVLGEGPDRESLTARAARLGLGDRVRFTGFKASPWADYAGADAFLLPSRWEGMPNAALEALACGTPVIAVPEAGGIGEVAAEAGPSAIRIAAWGDDFLVSMRAVRPASPHHVRPSLLPRRYHLEETTAKLAALLDG